MIGRIASSLIIRKMPQPIAVESLPGEEY